MTTGNEFRPYEIAAMVGDTIQRVPTAEFDTFDEAREYTKGLKTQSDQSTIWFVITKTLTKIE